MARETGATETEVPEAADPPEQNTAHRPYRGKSEAAELSPEASALWKRIETADAQRAPREPEDAAPLATLRRPVEAAPDSVKEQLLYILKKWGSVLGDWAAGLIGALDMIEEEQRPRFGGPGPGQRPVFTDMDENARFSSDDDWMPRVVLIAKNILVWLDQLSKNYGREIRTLDAVPDEELDGLASRGFNALWLIGLWERSDGSREIKRRMGNPEAAASAYSLYGYDIAGELGGWDALENLRGRAASRGIRLSSDMVPNHVGLDSDWVRHHPDRLLSTGECPYPGYSFNSDNLSRDGNVDIRLEDHYWDRSDAAVVFKRTDRNTGEVRYVYHGNDGTTMPWNDTAQIDFLNPEAREAVIQDILHVARNFPIIRFDAAMVLARKHIRRLWYPAPGAGGAIPSRSEYALSDEDFMKACPEEFWREVVDRVAAEVPGTLLLAEAFWMMEGYFVRVLGMHRVYNSAFMNMLRDQKNREYRDMIKETLAFDPRILQRFVNFMNNPDEETAVDQFGNDDRYFAACTLLATLPGLPMFGHGQIEGLSEKYGMEYIRAYKDEQPDPALIGRHEREIFPLLEQRAVFAGAPSFRLYDLHGSEGVNENVFAFTNTGPEGRCLVIVNNSFERAAGQIHRSAPVNIGDMKILNENLDTALSLNTVSDGDWLLLRDFISNLWYLRSAAELKRNGLSILIDGFGRQIFMDFRVEPETSDGLWGKLAAELKGAGIPDPDAALGEIRLRPLHQLLDTLISVDIINRTADIIRRGKSPFPRGSGNFFPKETALTLLGIDRSRSEILHTVIERRMNGSAVHFRFFGGGIRRKMKRLYGLPEWDEAVFLSLWSILFSLKENSDVEAGIWESWGLEKWLEKSGIGAGDKRLFQALKVILSVKSLIEKNSDSAVILSGLFSLPVIRESCSVNEWDDVLWYSREGWIQLFQVLFPASAADSEPGRKKRQLYRKIRKTMRNWYLADKKASYHLSHLLHAAR
jgi:glycosidase